MNSGVLRVARGGSCAKLNCQRLPTLAGPAESVNTIYNVCGLARILRLTLGKSQQSSLPNYRDQSRRAS